MSEPTTLICVIHVQKLFVFARGIVIIEAILAEKERLDLEIV